MSSESPIQGLARRLGGLMNCKRCNGLMYKMDLRDSKGFERLTACVCVICGEMIDPLITVNRQKDMTTEVILPTSVPRHSKYWRKLKPSMKRRETMRLSA
jgi:hypothetical protein